MDTSGKSGYNLASQTRKRAAQGIESTIGKVQLSSASWSAGGYIVRHNRRKNWSLAHSLFRYKHSADKLMADRFQ